MEPTDNNGYHGVRPNTVCFNAAIGACKQAGKWQEAVELLAQMHQPESPVRPNRISYNSAMAACTKAGEWQEAQRLLLELKQSGQLQPDVVSYNTVIGACARAPQPAWRKAVELLMELQDAFDEQQKGVEPRGGWRQDQSVPLAPDVVSYSTAMAACVRGGEHQLAVSTPGTLVRLPVPDSAVSEGSRAKNACAKKKHKIFNGLPKVTALDG